MIVDDEEILTLPIHVVHELFQYIHPDLKYIIHRCDDDDNKLLDIGLIMNSNLEDYFEDVLLSFKDALCDACSKRGQLDSLKWARKKGCPWHKTDRDNKAAHEIGLEDMLYINPGMTDTLQFWSDRELAQIAEFFLEEQNHVTEKGACVLAARAGHLHIIQWAREDGCPWNLSTSLAAAEAGHLHILQWLQENDCPWHTKICRTAAERGHLHILQWLRESHRDDFDSEFDSRMCSAAAGAGQLHVLQWLRDNGCPWNSDSYHAAALNGFAEIVEWVVKNGGDTS